MRRFVEGTCLLLGMVVLSACASSVPPNRLSDYVALQGAPNDTVLAIPDQRPVRAGLVVVPDTADAQAAPGLPDEALVRLAENLQQDLGRVLPVDIREVISAEGIRPVHPGGDKAQFAELGRKHGLDYLVVVVVSSTEQEYPVYLFLGWTTHMQPGFRRDNWTLLEFALLDLKNGNTVGQAEARGWATLDSPTAPGIDQWYPVVYLRPNDPVRRFWPPTYEGAPNTLRVVSANDAAKRLTFKLQNAWIEQREAEAIARRS